MTQSYSKRVYLSLTIEANKSRYTEPLTLGLLVLWLMLALPWVNVAYQHLASTMQWVDTIIATTITGVLVTIFAIEGGTRWTG